MRELARSRVGVNEIELAGCRPFQECCAVQDLKFDSGVVTEVPLCDLNNVWVNVDRHETRVRIHTREKPCGSNPRAGTEFEKVALRFGSSQGAKQGARLRLRGHRETDGFRFALNLLQHYRRTHNLVIVHG